MQLQQVSTASSPGRPVAVSLWLALVAAGSWALFQPATEPPGRLALAIGLLTLFVAAIVATFSLRYMRSDLRSSRYFLSLVALVASVLGFLFSGNLLVLGLAWCASGWLLARMIGHSGGGEESALASARALRAFRLGDAALLAALGILGSHAGSWEIDAALGAASSLDPILASIAALLLVAAAAARCALPPFSGWLLSSMTAPTPVSALMHAGLVNAGGFLLIRFAPLLEAAPAARIAAVALGLGGAIYGIGVMIVRPDVKRGLAGSTVSQMGFMIMSCGLGAYAAALWHIIAHGLFKSWLFLGSGSTIGMRTAGTAQSLSGRATGVIAAGTVAVAIAALYLGNRDASLVPLLLGLATATSTFLASLGGKAPARAKATLLLTLAALILFHGAGLALAALAVGPGATPLVPGWVLVSLLAVFLGAWSWQQHRVATGRGLPLPLYVHLINSGAMRTPGKGEAQ